MISAEEARSRLVKYDEQMAQAWLIKASDAVDKAVLNNRRNVDLEDVASSVFEIVSKEVKALGYEIKRVAGSGCGSSDKIRITW